MYACGKATSERPSLVPAAAHPCCLRQGCSLIEWKALALPWASSPTRKAESAKHVPSTALPSSSGPAPRTRGAGAASPALGACPCHGVTAQEGKQLGCVWEAGINHSWEGGTTGASLKNPTCRHCQVLRTRSPSKQPLPQRFPSLLLLLQLHSTFNLSIYSCSTSFWFWFSQKCWMRKKFLLPYQDWLWLSNLILKADTSISSCIV